jgi:activator of HSP90 ATPase
MYFFRNQLNQQRRRDGLRQEQLGLSHRKCRFQGKPIEVYDALINARIHSEFTGSKATCNPKVQGKFTAWDGYISGKNLKLNRGTEVVQEWKTTE